MTYALGRLFLSPPVTARSLFFSSHNNATRNSPPQCKLRRQNHGGGGVKFDVAPTRKEAIANGFSNSFCPMYFGRRRCISSASESTPPEEHDSDKEGAIVEKKEEEEKTTTEKDYRGSNNRYKHAGYTLLAILGWSILEWMRPDFSEQLLCRVVGITFQLIFSAIMFPFVYLASIMVTPSSFTISGDLLRLLFAVFFLFPFMWKFVRSVALLLFVATVLVSCGLIDVDGGGGGGGGADDDPTAAAAAN
ncbi:hypothetical protein LINPERHAP1_LOCUS34846 [Linum perenne]